MAPSNYRITIAGQTYEVEVGDLSSSPVQVSVDGTVYQVEIPESGSTASVPSVVTKPPQVFSRATVPVSGDDGVVRAPMPGRIVNVSVAVGDRVTKGQSILVLESMKMENTVSSPINGTVSAVHVEAGDSIQHGQTLAEIGQA